ncbi:MAG: adenylyltransferase/cytidyltransferase family protein [Clostridia bacterium]|nr:adenylyltransferase/cytidyltransferase family protein [Clostridia bacterium]
MEKKYKIGYTTGVFDLFHIGHLNILKKSKELCDYLIVGVSTDELVQEYKKKTPMIPFSERVAIVEAIKYVDQVVPQTSMDKFQAWEALKFDVMFHGNDWKNSSLYKEIEEKFQQVGVAVEYFEYTKNTSSTKLQTAIGKLNEQID